MDGDLAPTLSTVATVGPAQISKRVYSKGNFMTNFGWDSIIRNLQQGVESGKFQQTFGWTVSWNQKKTIEAMVNTAQVNGLIYGHASGLMMNYYDMPNVRSTFADVADVVKNSPRGLYLATNDDIPW